MSELGTLKKFEQLLVIRRREDPAIGSRMLNCKVDWNLEPFKRYLLRKNDSISDQVTCFAERFEHTSSATASWKLLSISSSHDRVLSRRGMNSAANMWGQVERENCCPFGRHFKDLRWAPCVYFTS